MSGALLLHDVETFIQRVRSDRHQARVVMRKIPRFLLVHPRRDVDGARVPHERDGRRMGPAIGTYRGEQRDPGTIQPRQHIGPRGRRRAGHAEPGVDHADVCRSVHRVLVRWAGRT